MSRKKVFLYVSAAFAWIFILMCTFLQDHSNGHAWSDYMESEALVFEEGASIQYGPLASGDTQVTLQYGKHEVEAILPQEQVSRRAFFPAGAKHIGISFANPQGLDTLVLFDAEQAHVFTHVVAMDSDTGRIATLQANSYGGTDLVVSNFNNEPVGSVGLEGHDASFLTHPKIMSAAFVGNHFELQTEKGTFSVVSGLTI